MALHFEMRSDGTAGSLIRNGGQQAVYPYQPSQISIVVGLRVLRSLMFSEAFARVGAGSHKSLANADVPSLLQDRARGYS